MSHRTQLHDMPGRVATGAYILHSGLGKWRADADHAAALHGQASKAFPVLEQVPPRIFVKVLSAAELATGALLLIPFVPTALAGSVLTAFSGGLVAMYMRTPEMREPGSIWPSRSGMAVSKDSWMLGMGVGLVLDATGRRLRASRAKIDRRRGHGALPRAGAGRAGKESKR
ncbi:MAG: hypothetical protein ACRDZ5_10215 [Acidimicrobiales bacterium]